MQPSLAPAAFKIAESPQRAHLWRKEGSCWCTR